MFKRPDRRLPTFKGKGRQKEAVPGARRKFPGSGDRQEQFTGELEESSHEPAKDGHHDLEKFSEPGRDLFRVPKAPQRSCHPRAGILEHNFSHGVERRARINNTLMAEVMATGFLWIKRFVGDRDFKKKNGEH